MTTKLTTVLTDLNKQAFIKHILKQGDVYLVGGIVRDSFLEKENKDIDLLVTGIPTDVLISLLMPFGKVDAVGKSFGVLKFMPLTMNLTEPIDIAIPRTETKIGEVHTDFAIVADHELSVEADLKRRDFTVNAIAVKLDGTVIDPFNGLQDLKDKLIKMVDEVAFVDDPLRMLRAVQFASRLAFTIDQVTLSTIQTKVDTIKHISQERILIELEKIQSKGNVEVGFRLLTQTGLFKAIFKTDTDFSNVAFDLVKSRGDFFFTLLRDFGGVEITTDTAQVFRDCRTKSEAFKRILKGDNDTADCLDALQFGFDNAFIFVAPNRRVAFDMFKKSKMSFDSGILPTALMTAISELKSGKFPKTLKDLAIDGNDLIKVGHSGKQIGDLLDVTLMAVLLEMSKNTKEELLKSIEGKKTF